MDEMELKIKALELAIKFYTGYGDESQMLDLAKKIYDFLVPEQQKGK